MRDGYQIAAAILVIGLIRPIVWLLGISVPLYLSKRLGMSDDTGRAIFGHYWDPM